MTTPQFPGEKPVASPLERHRMKMEARREAQERERHEAEAANRLWTIYGSLKMSAQGDRTAFILAFRGRVDDEVTRESFDTQHPGSILMGPQFVIGDNHEIAGEIARLVKVDTMTIRWVV